MKFRTYIIVALSATAFVPFVAWSVLHLGDMERRIAEADLELRGSGNLIGEKQSGYNHYVDLILSKPDLYAKAKKLADELTESEKLALVGRYKEHEELEENL